MDNKKYPEIADDFARTFRVLKSLKCDVFLGAHGSYYGLEEKYARLQKGGSESVHRSGWLPRLRRFQRKGFPCELAKQGKQ